LRRQEYQTKPERISEPHFVMNPGAILWTHPDAAGFPQSGCDASRRRYGSAHRPAERGAGSGDRK
jgi:hypothetical protein